MPDIRSLCPYRLLSYDIPLPPCNVAVLPVLRFPYSRELRYVPLHSVHLNTASDGWTEHMPYSPSVAIRSWLSSTSTSASSLPIQARVPWRSSNDKTAHGSTTHWLRPAIPSFGITVSPLIYSHKWNVWVETSRQSHPKLSPDRKAKGRTSSAHCMTKANKRQKAVGMPNKY